MQELCDNCGSNGDIRLDFKEGTSVCVLCGLVSEMQYMNDTFKMDDDFLDNECYDYYPLIEVENDLPLLFIKQAYNKAINIINDGNYRGSNKINIHAATIFIVCKENNISRTYQEICFQYKITSVKLSKGIKICLESGLFEKIQERVVSSELTLFNRYICMFPMHDSGISKCIRSMFLRLLGSTETIMIGKSTKTIVSCIICYIFEHSELNEKIVYNKHDISNKLNITTVTLNKNTKLIQLVTTK